MSMHSLVLFSRMEGGDVRNMKIFKVVVSNKRKKIESAINDAANDGWEVQEFGYGSLGLVEFWALLVKED
jgi:hypothetical protein